MFDQRREETKMTGELLRVRTVLALTLASGAALADDPTGVLLQERGQAPKWPGPLPEIIDGGSCPQRMQSESFPNQQGFRCIRTQ
jgi:hypothetical protein